MQGRKERQAASARQDQILATEEARTADEQMAAIRDRVRLRNAALLRAYGAPSGGAGRAPSATGGNATSTPSWLTSGWRSGQRQGFSFLRFGR